MRFKLRSVRTNSAMSWPSICPKYLKSRLSNRLLFCNSPCLTALPVFCIMRNRGGTLPSTRQSLFLKRLYDDEVETLTR